MHFCCQILMCARINSKFVYKSNTISQKVFNKGKWQFTQFTRYFRVTFWPYTYFKLFAISLARYLLRRANLHISICSTVAFRGFRIEWLPRMASWPPFFYTSYCFGRTIIPHLTTFLRAFSGRFYLFTISTNIDWTHWSI